MLPLISLVALVVSTSGAPLEADPFLKPYVAELKRELSAPERERVAASAEKELIQLHHGYGTAIRNRWLWGKQDERLLRFFRDHGVRHPDDMSMVLIRALWLELRAERSSAQNAKDGK